MVLYLLVMVPGKQLDVCKKSLEDTAGRAGTETAPDALDLTKLGYLRGSRKL
jgi:hypothetical protein